MYSTYKLNADELTTDLIQAIKQTYLHKNIEIVIQDVEDETEYLLKSPKNRERLLKAKSNIENHKNLIELDSRKI